MVRKSFKERFWEKVNRTDSCWLWTSAVGGSLGYGVFWVGGGKSKYAHRVSWEMERGPIKDGMCVLHKCDTPLCVNPDHLFIGTYADNKADCVAKGRHAKGERNGGGGKLTWDQVCEIRKTPKAISGDKLAPIFGVNKSIINRIRRHDLWVEAR